MSLHFRYRLHKRQQTLLLFLLLCQEMVIHHNCALCKRCHNGILTLLLNMPRDGVTPLLCSVRDVATTFLPTYHAESWCYTIIVHCIRDVAMPFLPVAVHAERWYDTIIVHDVRNCATPFSQYPLFILRDGVTP